MGLGELDWMGWDGVTGSMTDWIYEVKLESNCLERSTSNLFHYFSISSSYSFYDILKLVMCTHL